MQALQAERTPETNAPAGLLESLDCLRVAVTIFDSSGRLIFANAHYNYLFPSLPPWEELTGKSHDELVRLEIAGGELAFTGDAENYVAERRTLLGVREHTRDIALADGRVVEIKARRAPGGNAILLWTDVTQARHQFQRLEIAIGLSADAVAFFDAQDRLVMANGRYLERAGAASLDEIRGRPFIEIVTKAVSGDRFVLDMPREQWLARRLAGHRAPAYAYTLLTKSGAAFLVRDRATPDGGRASVFTDITDVKRAENALAEQVAALADSRTEAEKQKRYLADLTHRLDAVSAEADTAKTTLLRTMSHELKTPLNIILGFSDLMDTSGDRLRPEQWREYARMIHQSGTSLLKMLNAIMDLTKIAAGRYELRRTPIDAGAALWRAKDTFQYRADAHNISIDADLCPVGLMADADENVFEAMTSHLIDNALVFTPDGGRIALSVAREGALIRILVADNGRGVAPEDLVRILEPFEHAGRSVGDHPAGAGLGLTLVKAFAELHGGGLSIESAPGEGFRACIDLPAATAISAMESAASR